MNFRSPRVIIGLLLSLVIVVSLTALGVFFMNPAASGKVLPGVTVMGMDLSNLDKTESVAKITEYEDELYSKLVEVKYLEQNIALPLSEIGLSLDGETIVEEALRVGREGNLIKQWKDRQNLKTNGVGLSPLVLFDRDKVLELTNEFTQGISQEPENAYFVVDDSETVTVNPGKDGYQVDLDKMIEDITDIISEGKKPEIELVLVTVPPERTTEALAESGVNGKLGSYYTAFNQSQINRSYNIKLAADAYDELLVQPGESVSFNETVGPRSVAAGYRNAPVIVNNQLVEGIGGGVCQVSTTIYNAVLLSGLEIVERTCHGLPVSYVPLGRDATVVDNAVDFVFRNNTANYLYIRTLVSGGRLTVNIFGDIADKKEVQVNSWVTQQIPPPIVYENDPNLPKGEEVVLVGGASGFRAAAERTFLSNGVVERRETLGSSSYNPQRRVIAVGVSEEAISQTTPAIVTPNQDVTDQGQPSDNNDRSGAPNANGGEITGGVDNEGVITGGATPSSPDENGSGSGSDSDSDNGANTQVNPGIPASN